MTLSPAERPTFLASEIKGSVAPCTAGTDPAVCEFARGLGELAHGMAEREIRRRTLSKR